MALVNLRPHSGFTEVPNSRRSATNLFKLHACWVISYILLVVLLTKEISLLAAKSEQRVEKILVLANFDSDFFLAPLLFLDSFRPFSVSSLIVFLSPNLNLCILNCPN